MSRPAKTSYVFGKVARDSGRISVGVKLSLVRQMSGPANVARSKDKCCRDRC